MKATAYISGEIRPIDGFANSNSILQFFKENGNADEYEIIINSPGGSVIEGWAMRDMIASMSNLKPVTTIGYTVMSIATKPFLAGTTRLVSQNTNFLIHNPWIPPVVGGEAKDLEKVAKSMRENEERSLREYMKYSNKTEDEMREMMNQETSIPAAELVEMGFATGILEENQTEQLQTYQSAIAYIGDKPNNFMDKMEKRLSVVEKLLNKFGKSEEEVALQIALDDSRIVEVVTKEGNKPKVGDTIRFEGKQLEDGEYSTAETQERFVVKDGKIEDIHDVSEETFSADEVLQFVQKAGERTMDKLGKSLELYAKSTDLEAIQAKHTSEMEAMQAKLDEAESKITEISQSFQEALKEIKASLFSDFGIEEEKNTPTERALKPWEVDMQKIKEKTNQV